ncbi:MAG: TadE family protein [Chloroflexota bacterium]
MMNENRTVFFSQAKKRPRKEQGTSLVEFAYIFPVYLLIVLGFFQLAIWGYRAAVGVFAARLACREAATRNQIGGWGTSGNVEAMIEAGKWMDQGYVVFPMGTSVSGISKGIEGVRSFSLQVVRTLPAFISSLGSARAYFVDMTCRIEHYYP